MSTLFSDVALALLCLGALVVLWGLLSPVKRLPTWSHKHDKLLHAVAFAVLAALAYASWPGIHLVGLWLALSLAGLASEGLQQLTPERRFCWRDAAANAAGAAVGLGLAGGAGGCRKASDGRSQLGCQRGVLALFCSCSIQFNVSVSSK